MWANNFELDAARTQSRGISCGSKQQTVRRNSEVSLTFRAFHWISSKFQVRSVLLNDDSCYVFGSTYKKFDKVNKTR